ncbi:hypothetical protein HK096_006120, partial [Nowakowskiella sp. JEL0078]
MAENENETMLVIPEEVQKDTEKQAETHTTLKKLAFLDRFLALWILLAMVIGLLLGYFTNTGEKLQQGEFIGVSIPIAVGLLVMMYPILCKVSYESLYLLLRKKSLYIHLGFSLFTNWIIAPLFMLGLAWAFLPDLPDLRDGLILVGIARCIAMVLIWTDLSDGDTDYCALLVAVNSVLQIVLFAPFALLYINVLGGGSNRVNISYSLVAKSVAVFLGIPLGAAIITRFGLVKLIGKKRYDGVFLNIVGPFSLIGLVFTIIVLFASQSKNVVTNIISVLRVCVPLIVYFVVIFSVTMATCRYFGRGERKIAEKGEENDDDNEKNWEYGKCVTQSFTAASNNFELAIAVAVASYGAGSQQALAATVGPLIEVPVMLLLVEVT